MILRVISAVFISFILIPICSSVEHDPPEIIEHPLDVIVSKGAPATLNCAAKGNNVTITWYRNGEKVITNKDQANSHRILLDSGSLFLLKTNSGKNGKDGDSGTYYCLAKNKHGEVKSNEGALKIAMLNDEFRIRPRTVQVIAGQRAVLECASPVGFPEPVVSWRKNEKEFRIDDSSRITFMPTGNLIFSPVEHGDSGTYQCVATNMVGERVSNPARLSVYEKPHFVKEPEDVTVDLGGSVLFNCTVSGEPQPQVYWTKKGDQMPVARAFIARDNKGLRIDNIQKSDEGEYVCHARNPTGSIESSARLRVQVLPSFEISPENQEVKLGGRAVFQCVPNGQPTPASFWSKEGDQNMFFPGYSSADNRIVVHQNGTLTVSDVKIDDEGSYLCAAMNSAGSALSKAKLNIVLGADEQYPPPVLEAVPQNQTVLVGMRVTMPCKGTARSHVDIDWHHNSIPIDFTAEGFLKSDDNSLILATAKKKHAGTFTCVAKSADGISTWNAELEVKDDDEKNKHSVRLNPEVILKGPGRPSAAEVTDSEIELTWHAAKENLDHGVSGYKIDYFSPSINKSWIPVHGIIHGTKFRINNLKSSSIYYFTVRAQNKHGVGSPSLISQPVHTKEATSHDQAALDFEIASKRLSTEQVINLKEAKTVNATAIQLIWIVRKYRDIIKGFYVKWRGPARKNIHQWVDVQNAETSEYIVNGLLPFTNYEFFIVPYHGNVQGVPSNSMEGLTAEAPPSLPPLDVRTRMLNLTSVRVSWKPPPLEGLNGILKGFQIEIIGEGNKYNRSITTKERAASVTLFHLTPRMTYRISVAARTNAGIGVSHPPDVITMDFETLEKHKELYGESSFIFFSLLRQAWFIVLLTVLGWIVLIAIAVFIFIRYKRNSSSVKNHNGSFIKINDGSIHVAHSALWDANTAVRLGRLPPGTRALGSQPLYSMTPGNQEFYDYNPHGQGDHLYHYAQVPNSAYPNKFQDDPSPYATTTIVMANDQTGYLNDGGTMFRPPPSDTIPNGPPFRLAEDMERIMAEQNNEMMGTRGRMSNSPHQPAGYYTRAKINGNSTTSRRSPPRQTLFDFIPPPPANPPPTAQLMNPRYDGVSNITLDNIELRTATQNRTAGARMQKVTNPDELSQRSSLLSDEDEELLQTLRDEQHASQTMPKKMPRMGISASILNQNN